MIRIPKPEPDEYLAYYGKYIALVGDDALAALRAQGAATSRLLASVNESQALFRYAPGKWSVKEVLGHVTDGERVFGFRALWFARKDPAPLPGFDENAWTPAGGFDRQPLPALLADYEAVRAATLALFASFDEPALVRRGSANGAQVSVRALAHIIAGHELHHLSLLRERYALA
jgi:hypothetical protein